MHSIRVNKFNKVISIAYNKVIDGWIHVDSIPKCPTVEEYMLSKLNLKIQNIDLSELVITDKDRDEYNPGELYYIDGILEYKVI